jgi:hypothetical protein
MTARAKKLKAKNTAARKPTAALAELLGVAHKLANDALLTFADRGVLLELIDAIAHGQDVGPRYFQSVKNRPGGLNAHSKFNAVIDITLDLAERTKAEKSAKVDAMTKWQLSENQIKHAMMAYRAGCEELIETFGAVTLRKVFESQRRTRFSENWRNRLR